MAVNSEYIFDYLDDVWELLPAEDRLRFAETWKAYEQTYGDVWAQLLDRQMANSIDYLPLYNVRRWQKYIFNQDNRLLRSSYFRSPQDLSLGINLSARYLLKMSIDGGTPFEVDMRGSEPLRTSLSEIVTRINQVAGRVVAYAVSDNQILEIRSPAAGPQSSVVFYATSSPDHDASEIVLGLDPISDLPKAFPKFPYEYLLPDTFIAAIPLLQNAVRDDNITLSLTNRTDFDIELQTGAISFKEEPPEILWAPDTLINQETPYNNYGFLLGIYDKNTASYLKAVKGLWYAFWTGPRPENIRRSLYLLFGLPTASAAGVVSSLEAGIISVSYDKGTTEDFAVPSGLTPLVTAGQRVERFEPLVSGIRVLDRINYPGFVEREAGRAGVRLFLTQHATLGLQDDTDESAALELLEANTYLPQIDLSSFISPDIKLPNVRTFLSTLQPKSRTYLFQFLVGRYRDELGLKDEGTTGNATERWPNGQPALGLHIRFDATPNIDSNLNTMIDQTGLITSEEDDWTYLQLDEGWATGDRIMVEVRKSGLLVDSFSLEG